MNNRSFLDIFENEQVKDLINKKDGSMVIKDMEKVTSTKYNANLFDYKKFKGEDVVTVSRDGLPLTIFREIK